MKEKGKYTTGDLAERFGLSTETIRNYENDFDLNIKRDNQNNRSYTEKDIKIYEEIVKLKGEGLSIEEINARLKDDNKDRSKTLDKLMGKVNKKKSSIKAYTDEFEDIKEKIETDMEEFIDEDVKKFIYQETDKVSKKIKKIEKKLNEIKGKIK